MTQARITLAAQDNTGPAFKSAQGNLARVQGAAVSAQSALALLGIGVSLAGFVAATKAAIDGLDALKDASDITGASVENLSALEDVARRNGQSLDTVTTSLVKFNQVLGGIKPGNDADQALKALGLRAAELKALDPAEALRQTAVALSAYADDANKARLVQELFGKSIREVGPGGAGGLGSLTSALGGLTGLGGSLSSGLSAGFSALLGESGISGAISAGLTSIGTATGSGIAAGLGTLAGAFGPIAIGVGALYNYFKSKRGGPKTESGFGPLVPNVGDPTAARAISQSITAGYTELARELGAVAGNLEVGVLTSVDSKGTALTQLAVEAVLDGQTVSSRGARLGSNENVGRTTEALAAAVAAETNIVIFEALRRSNLAPEFAEYLNSYVEQGTDPEQALNNFRLLAQTNTVLDSFGKTISGLASYSLDAQQRLSNFSGGLEALATRLTSYQQNYYSQSERDAQTRAAIAGQLSAVGLSLPGTRSELRALVDANLALGAAGAQTVSVLLGVEGAFASITPAAQDLDDSLSGLRRTIQELYGEVDSTRAFSAAQGRAFIDAALANGGPVDATQLGEATSAVRAGFNDFSTQADADFARLSLAGELSQIVARQTRSNEQMAAQMQAMQAQLASLVDAQTTGNDLARRSTNVLEAVVTGQASLSTEAAA